MNEITFELNDNEVNSHLRGESDVRVVSEVSGILMLEGTSIRTLENELNNLRENSSNMGFNLES